MTAAAWPQDYVIADGVSVQDWAGTLTVNQGTVAVVTDDVDSAFGATKSLKNTSNGANAAQARMPLSTSVVAAVGPNSVLLRVKAPTSNANPSPIEIRLYDAALAKYLFFYHTVPNNGRWNSIVISVGNMGSSSFVVGTDAIGHIQVREDRSGGRGLPNMQAGEYFLTGPVIVNRRSRPKMMFSIDDGRPITTDFAGYAGSPASGGNYRDIFDFYGVAATCYVIPDVFGTAGYGTLSEHLAAQADGWSIGTHSLVNEGGNVGNALHGLRTLGTFGYGPYTVSSVDTGTDVLTVTSHPFADGSLLTFSGDALPGGLSSGQSYFARSVSANDISLHPSYAAALANSGKVDITSAGSNVTCRWYNSAPNNTLIMSTLRADAEAIRALGFTGWQHYALPQGGSDREVIDAISSVGKFASVRGVGTGFPLPFGIGKISPIPDWYINDPKLIGYAFDLAALGAAGTIAQINNAVQYGASVGCYMHAITSTVAADLDAVLAHAVRLQKMGLIDIVTVEDWYRGLTQPALVA